MGDKSVRKKQYIIEKAREVFAQKGYKDVTMKDIVDACEISRGGLYLYFDSTRSLFLEILKKEQESEDIFNGRVSEDSTAAEILVMFLVEQKKEILRKRNSLIKATYEFYFQERPERKEDSYKKDYDSAQKVLQRVIEIGVESDELICDKPGEAATNIMLVLEGLKIMSLTIGISAEMIDKQFIYILNTLGVEDKSEN
ncbi:MAG: TetR/AcrR family transcriptional regulator [Lachnospiraceae bacterium]|nr:TetR/AcrR family transcriptional regulator [Lachnospiraceae bacterium]